MLRKLFLASLILLFSSLALAEHSEWYAQTDCYEKSRPNIEHCQKQYDALRLAHNNNCKNPSQTECMQFCEQFNLTQKSDCRGACISELPQAKARYFACLDNNYGNSYKGIYDYDMKPVPEPEKNVTRKPPLTRIGAAAGVDGEVTVMRVDGSTERLSSGKTIYHNDRIVTKENSRIQVLLLDETVFTISGGAELVLDDFVYDPNADIGKISASLAKGAFRFVTGKAARKDPSKIKIRLPVGTIGIRGTDFVAGYDKQNNIAALHLHEGEVEITTDAGKDIIYSGNSVTFSEIGIISEQKLTEAKWNSLIDEKKTEEKTHLVFVVFFLFILAAIIALAYLVVRKQKTKKISRLALFSFAMGVFSLLIGWIPILGWIFIILTLTLGFASLRCIKTQNLSGRKIALGGIFFGFVSLAIALIVVISFV